MVRMLCVLFLMGVVVLSTFFLYYCYIKYLLVLVLSHATMHANKAHTALCCKSNLMMCKFPLAAALCIAVCRDGR